MPYSDTFIYLSGPLQKSPHSRINFKFIMDVGEESGNQTCRMLILPKSPKKKDDLRFGMSSIQSNIRF